MTSPSAHATSRGGRRNLDDEGSIIAGWLVRLAVLLTVLGVGLFDAASVAVVHVNLPDQAGSAARAASESWQATPDIEQAYAAALASARDQNDANVVDTSTFRVDRDGTAHVTLRRTAQTYVLRRVSATRGWTHVQADGTARAVA